MMSTKARNQSDGSPCTLNMSIQKYLIEVVYEVGLVRNVLDGGDVAAPVLAVSLRGVPVQCL